MITIRSESGDVLGSCTYLLEINKSLICKFEHNSQEGPAECLKKAAQAVELNQWAEFEIMNDSKGG